MEIRAVRYLKERPFVRPFLGQILEGKREPQPLFATKESARQYIENRLTQRRNDFIAEYKKGDHGSSVLTYEPALDREVYKELQRVYKENVRQIQELRIANRHDQKEHLFETHSAAYEEVLKGLNGYTRFQVETFIGERLNVGLSKYQYDLRPNEEGIVNLYGQTMSEPLVEMIKRGRDTRDIIGNDIDKPRQDAEVALFEQIQDVMSNPKTEVGTTILSFSPPGKKRSSYAHNFYDVFTLREKEGENGEKIRYVEARRYASGLSIDDSLSKASELQAEYSRSVLVSGQPVDAFLIGHPLVFRKGHEFFDKADELHKTLQGDPNALSYDDFQRKVVKDPLFAGMVNHYLKTLQEHPEDKKLLNKTLDAIMNRADEIMELRDKISVKHHEWHGLRRHASVGPMPLDGHLDAYINTYSKQKVRQVSTGCGSSGGLGGENGKERLPVNLSPTRGTEAASGEDKYGKRIFECPDCHELNLREYNQLLPECQHCGSEKVAC